MEAAIFPPGVWRLRGSGLELPVEGVPSAEVSHLQVSRPVS